MYKLCIFFAFLVAVSHCALTQEQRQKLKDYDEECKTISQIDPDVLEKARTGEFVNDSKLKEHLFCLSKKIGFQNEAGEIQKDKLREKLALLIDDDAKAAETVNKCAIQQSSPQQTAFDTIKCYSDEAF